MNKRKAGGMSIAVLGIIFLVYNMLVFFVFKPQTPTFWVSYAFMIVAFLSQIASLFISTKTLDVQTVFFGIPLIQFSIFYFFAELFASVVFMIFQNHVNIKVPIAIQVIILAAFIIIAIIAVGARDTVKDIKETADKKVAAFKSIAVDVEMIAETVEDPELKKMIQRVAEDINYSDPMSNDAVADVEKRIYMCISELRVNCDHKDYEEARENCENLSRLVMERSKKIMLSK